MAKTLIRGYWYLEAKKLGVKEFRGVSPKMETHDESGQRLQTPVQKVGADGRPQWEVQVISLDVDETTGEVTDGDQETWMVPGERPQATRGALIELIDPELGVWPDRNSRPGLSWTSLRAAGIREDKSAPAVAGSEKGEK